MRIRVYDDYRNAAGVSIPRGEYDGDDPALEGLASYLVKTKQAARLVDPFPESDQPPEDVPPTQKPYKAMNKAELTKLANDRNVDISEAKTNPDIIKLLEAADKVKAAAANDAPPPSKPDQE